MNTGLKKAKAALDFFSTASNARFYTWQMSNIKYKDKLNFVKHLNVKIHFEGFNYKNPFSFRTTEKKLFYIKYYFFHHKSELVVNDNRR